MDVEFIHSPHAWDYFAERVGNASIVALSTEDATLHSYRGELCLLQVHAVGEDGASLGVAVVDVLAVGRALRWPWSGTSTSERAGRPAAIIVHGGEYTVANLKRFLGWSPEPLIDTQQAAVLLGLEATGYRNLCRSLLERDLGAAPSVDWRRRPVDPQHLDAAADDVRHLPDLWRALAVRIRAADLDEECLLAGREVAATPASANRSDPSNAWHSREARALPRSRWALFHALVAWRERKAREFDLPPGRLVPNRGLVELAASGGEGFDHAPGFHSRLTWPDREEVERLVRALRDAPADVMELGMPRRESGHPPGPEEKARLAALKRWRQAEAQRRGVGLQAVLPGAILHLLARSREVPEAAITAMGDARWRRYGGELGRLIAAPVAPG